MKNSVVDSRHNLPLMFEPESQAESCGLGQWCRENQALLASSLETHGAVLFRGFDINDELKFEHLVRETSGKLSDYVDGNSPRKKVRSGIYTSTEYPPEFFISLHNELSYANCWPERLFFCCLTPAESGGETALADSRAILRDLPPTVLEEFRNRQVRYIRNLHGGIGFGKGWQETFETSDRATVEKYARESNTAWQWGEDGGLRLYSVRASTARHPVTGEEVWFNQADQFHPSTHPKEMYDTLMMLYEGNEDQLPQNATFGDGDPIPLALLEKIRQSISEHIVLFPWQRGDVLVVDNMLVCHGRTPFTGPRQILVAMTGERSWPLSDAVADLSAAESATTRC